MPFKCFNNLSYWGEIQLLPAALIYILEKDGHNRYSIWSYFSSWKNWSIEQRTSLDLTSDSKQTVHSRKAGHRKNDCLMALLELVQIILLSVVYSQVPRRWTPSPTSWSQRLLHRKIIVLVWKYPGKDSIEMFKVYTVSVTKISYHPPRWSSCKRGLYACVSYFLWCWWLVKIHVVEH